MNLLTGGFMDLTFGAPAARKSAAGADHRIRAVRKFEFEIRPRIGLSVRISNFKSDVSNPSSRTERLRMLEAEGWVSRDYKPTIPPEVTYAITKKVLELDGVMIELDRIAERWYGKGRGS